MSSHLTIYKYALLNRPGEQVIWLPRYSKVLTLQLVAGHTPTMWIEHDIHQETEPRKFHTVGTGFELDPDKHVVYIGTYQLDGFVWHVYLE